MHFCTCTGSLVGSLSLLFRHGSGTYIVHPLVISFRAFQDVEKSYARQLSTAVREVKSILALI